MDINKIKFSRKWAMPHKDTFFVKPIAVFMNRYKANGAVSLDPFSRNCDIATYTNDLNPQTSAQYHLDSVEFLLLMEQKGIEPDFVILDPPYSPEQMKRAYDSFGLKMNGTDALRTAGWKEEKDIIARITRPGAIVLSFGWNSCGMGKGRGFERLEIMLVCHGAGHHDTICVAERKLPELF